MSAYFCSRSRILLFHMCFGIIILSPFHLATQIIPIHNINCTNNAKNASGDMSFGMLFYECGKHLVSYVSLCQNTCGARSLCLTLEWLGGQSLTCEWELTNASQARVATLRSNFQSESWFRKFLCVKTSYSSKLLNMVSQPNMFYPVVSYESYSSVSSAHIWLNKLPTHWLCNCFIDLQDDIAEASLSNLKLG